MALGEQMVADVLTDEQLAWIRAHHERWDGGGYPDGLTGDEIPDGAALPRGRRRLGRHDRPRVYAARSREDALAECERPRRPVRARARRRAGGDVPGRGAHNVCPVILKPCARSAGVTTPEAKRRP